MSNKAPDTGFSGPVDLDTATAEKTVLYQEPVSVPVTNLITEEELEDRDIDADLYSDDDEDNSSTDTKKKDNDAEMSDEILKKLIDDSFDNEKAKSISDKSNQEGRICIPLSNYEDFRANLISKIKQMGETAWLRDRFDTTTEAGAIWESSTHFQAQTDLMKHALEQIKIQNTQIKDLHEVLVSNIEGVIERVAKRPKDPKETVITGKKARNRAISLIQGVRRVVLWNSGFYITVRPMYLHEISLFYNTVNKTEYAYGRELGAHFYIYQDIIIKEVFLTQILPNVIIDSNLSEWNKMGSDIINYISIHDYDTILWALSTLMFRNGINVNYCCSELMDDNTPCGNIDTKLVNIEKLRLINSDYITDEVKAFMNPQDTVTVEQVLKYQNTLIRPKNDTYRFELNSVSADKSFWEIKLRVPSSGIYLKYGADYNTDLFSNIGKDADRIALDEVEEYLRFNLYKAFIPWIGQVNQLSSCEPDARIIAETPNNPDSKVDRATMKEILDVFLMENINMDKPIIDFINTSKITHIAYQYEKCPKCGKPPKTAIDGFIPHDVQAHFFNLGFILLIATQR